MQYFDGDTMTGILKQIQEKEELLKVIEDTSGLIKDWTPEERKRFDEAVNWS